MNAIVRTAEFKPKTPFKSKGPFKPKPQRWSHQKELDALKGKVVELLLPDGQKICGQLIEADQFTIKIKNGSNNAVIFKHAIAGFNQKDA